MCMYGISRHSNILTKWCGNKTWINGFSISWRYCRLKNNFIDDEDDSCFVLFMPREKVAIMIWILNIIQTDRYKIMYILQNHPRNAESERSIFTILFKALNSVKKFQTFAFCTSEMLQFLKCNSINSWEIDRIWWHVMLFTLSYRFESQQRFMHCFWLLINLINLYDRPSESNLENFF